MSMVNKTPTNNEIVKFLSSTTSDASFLQSIKIKYRPYVCPFNELLQYVGDAKSVYDIGCGSGQFSALVARYTNADTVGGIEIDSKLVENANEINKQFQESGKSMHFSVFDGKTIPKDIANYDVIYMIDVYHHIPVKIREAFMRNLYKKMAVGSRLVFKDIDAASPLVPFNKLHDLVFAQELSHEISHAAAHKLLTSLGLSVIESYKKSVFIYPHYFLVAEK